MIVSRLPSMPRLAWVVHVTADDVEATVGPWVETGDGWLVEGAWAGPFDEVGFADSYSFMGSGVVETDEGVLAVASCAPHEAIYSLTVGGSTFVSNSIALLLTASGQALDLDYLDYEADVLSIAKGLGHKRTDLPLAEGLRARRHYYCNLVVAPAGVREEPKPLPPVPADYAQYRQFLSSTTASIAANASDPARGQKYAPIVFCSQGYDSTACAVLGREIGCTEAVAFETKRTTRSDAGTATATALGYETVHLRQERDYLSFDNAELFLGTGELGTSLFFASAGDLLEGRLLLSGGHGDHMWDRLNREDEGARFERSALPNTARSEFRLATGYVSYPPAILTGMFQPEINDISISPEMAPWTLGTSYDRPIARRIAEEAGVPRELFGQQKGGGAGSSLRYGNRRRLSVTMAPASFARFAPYLDQARRRRRKSLTWPFRAAAYSVYALTILLHGRGRPELKRLLKPHTWPIPLTCSPFAPSYLFPWAVTELQRGPYAEVSGPES